MVKEYCAMAIVVVNKDVLYTIESVKGVSRTSLPKGHIEANETHLQTAIRECMEETGVILNASEFYQEIDSFQYEFDNPFNDNKHTLKTIYPLIFKLDEKRTPRISEKNILLADYLEIDSLIEKATFNNIKEILEKVKLALSL